MVFSSLTFLQCFLPLCLLAYKHINRSVSYDNGQYETDSIYERKYLSCSDQYAVFLNSNQAQTVIEGSGKSGKLLLIKDSYGNTFSQFPVEDYTFLFEPKVISSGVSGKFFSDHSVISSGCTSAKLLFIAKPQPPCA